jgi:hypothetical protein
MFFGFAGEDTGHTGKRVSRCASNFDRPTEADSWHRGYAGCLGCVTHAKPGERQRFVLRR